MTDQTNQEPSQGGDPGSTFLFEAFDPVNRADPYPLYARMRDHQTVLDAGNNLWFTFSHSAANSLLRAKHVSSDERRSNFYRSSLTTGDLPQHIIDREPNLLFLDPPDHNRLRGLVNSAFTQKRVEQMVPKIQERTAQLLDDMDGTGTVDLVERLAYPLPVAVICELLGVPESDHEQFGSWSRDLTKGLDPVGPTLRRRRGGGDRRPRPPSRRISLSSSNGGDGSRRTISCQRCSRRATAMIS